MSSTRNGRMPSFEAADLAPETGNADLHNTVSGQAFRMATDYERASFYRRLAEEANRNYEKGRDESIKKAVDDARRMGRIFGPADVAEAEALGKTRWTQHHVGMTYARDASYYREMSVFYAVMWANSIAGA